MKSPAPTIIVTGLRSELFSAIPYSLLVASLTSSVPTRTYRDGDRTIRFVVIKELTPRILYVVFDVPSHSSEVSDQN